MWNLGPFVLQVLPSAPFLASEPKQYLVRLDRFGTQVSSQALWLSAEKTFRDRRRPNKEKENPPFCIHGKVIPEVRSELTSMKSKSSGKERLGLMGFVEQLLSEDPATRLSVVGLTTDRKKCGR